MQLNVPDQSGWAHRRGLYQMCECTGCLTGWPAAAPRGATGDNASSNKQREFASPIHRMLESLQCIGLGQGVTVAGQPCCPATDSGLSVAVRCNGQQRRVLSAAVRGSSWRGTATRVFVWLLDQFRILTVLCCFSAPRQRPFHSRRSRRDLANSNSKADGQKNTVAGVLTYRRLRRP